MKFFLLFIIVFFNFAHANSANDLMFFIESAYKNNPKLNAERANMRASKEEKREAISEFLPSITISGYVSEQENTIPGDNTDTKNMNNWKSETFYFLDEAERFYDAR